MFCVANVFNLQTSDTNRIIRENKELKEEVEALKRLLPLRRHLEEKDLEKKYEESQKLNDWFKDQVIIFNDDATSTAYNVTF